MWLLGGAVIAGLVSHFALSSADVAVGLGAAAVAIACLALGLFAPSKVRQAWALLLP